jgi:hypothetical protein
MKMTEERLTYLMIKDTIDQMPAADQQTVHDVAEKLRELVKASVGHGHMAMALVGAELAMEP